MCTSRPRSSRTTRPSSPGSSDSPTSIVASAPPSRCVARSPARSLASSCGTSPCATTTSPRKSGSAASASRIAYPVPLGGSWTTAFARLQCSASQADTSSRRWPTTTATTSGEVPSTARRTWSSSGSPRHSTKTFGLLARSRVPLPAASTTAASGRCEGADARGVTVDGPGPRGASRARSPRARSTVDPRAAQGTGAIPEGQTARRGRPRLPPAAPLRADVGRAVAAADGEQDQPEAREHAGPEREDLLVAGPAERLLPPVRVAREVVGPEEEVRSVESEGDPAEDERQDPSHRTLLGWLPCHRPSLPSLARDR